MPADQSTPLNNPKSDSPDGTRRLPLIIQGGMGVAVSNWRLAGTVSALGQLGGGPGTAMATVMVRRLQDGDPDGAMALAFAQFPIPEVADRIWKKYFVPGGKPGNRAYALAPPQK